MPYTLKESPGETSRNSFFSSPLTINFIASAVPVLMSTVTSPFSSLRLAPISLSFISVTLRDSVISSAKTPITALNAIVTAISKVTASTGLTALLLIISLFIHLRCTE
jgi:hypothetical protein